MELTPSGRLKRKSVVTVKYDSDDQEEEFDLDKLMEEAEKQEEL